jgi:hypothetical protein
VEGGRWSTPDIRAGTVVHGGGLGFSDDPTLIVDVFRRPARRPTTTFHPSFLFLFYNKYNRILKLLFYLKFKKTVF